MPTARAIIHPRMLQRQLAGTRYYPNVVRFEARSQTQDSAGQPLNAWAAIPAMSRIPCRIDPAIAQGGGAISDATHIILLVGDFAPPTLSLPLLNQTNLLSMLRVVDSGGMVYAVLRLESDADRTLTRALCRQQPAGTT